MAADVPNLRDVRLIGALERAFAAVSGRQDLRLVHYSIQRDHVHLTIETAGRHELGRGMKSLSARIARTR